MKTGWVKLHSDETGFYWTPAVVTMFPDGSYQQYPRAWYWKMGEGFVVLQEQNVYGWSWGDQPTQDAPLDDAAVRDINRRLVAGEEHGDIARQYGVPRQTVENLAKLWTVPPDHDR